MKIKKESLFLGVVIGFALSKVMDKKPTEDIVTGTLGRGRIIPRNFDNMRPVAMIPSRTLQYQQKRLVPVQPDYINPHLTLPYNQPHFEYVPAVRGLEGHSYLWNLHLGEECLYNTGCTSL